MPVCQNQAPPTNHHNAESDIYCAATGSGRISPRVPAKSAIPRLLRDRILGGGCIPLARLSNGRARHGLQVIDGRAKRTARLRRLVAWSVGTAPKALLIEDEILSVGPRR